MTTVSARHHLQKVLTSAAILHIILTVQMFGDVDSQENVKQTC